MRFHAQTAVLGRDRRLGQAVGAPVGWSRRNCRSRVGVGVWVALGPSACTLHRWHGRLPNDGHFYSQAPTFAHCVWRSAPRGGLFF